MEMFLENQFRKDPVSGQWVIIIENHDHFKKLLEFSRERRQPDKVEKTKYSEGFEQNTLAEIFAIRDEGSEANQPNWKVRVIPYEQPFLQIHGELESLGIGLYDVIKGIGAHELVLESPKPNIRIPELGTDQVEYVFTAYKERILDLKKDDRFRCIIVQNNHGEATGDLKYHAHSHIIAMPIIPARVKNGLRNNLEHYHYKERCLFCDIISQEQTDKSRIISENEHFIALSPFASRSPFSTWILPKAHSAFFEWATELESLAAIYHDTLVKIGTVLNSPNYVMVLNTGPNIIAGQERDYWKTLEKDYHWFIEITPRFRSYSSFETGSGIQVNVVSPEKATQLLNGNLKF